MPSFDARGYWNSRLDARWTIGGTGHLQYSTEYNRWLYRAKRDALKAALRGVPPGRSYDIGSGVGWVVQQLQSLGWDVRGCDIAPVAVERLRAELPAVTFDLLDVGSESIPLPAQSVELVTALDVVYHVVDDTAFDHVLAEAARILRPGGRLVVSDTVGSADERPAEHVHFRGESSWRAAASRNGLAVAELQPYFRLLSRPPEASRLRRAPDSVRGAVEYAADRFLPLRPWMRLAVLTPA